MIGIDPGYNLGFTFSGLNIVYNDQIVDPKTIIGCNFKPSRHRSARQHKKLLKRFGCQYKFAPGILHHVPSQTLFVHPHFKPELEKKLRAQGRAIQRSFEDLIFRSISPGWSREDYNSPIGDPWYG
jgi:hypothetical protein